jgi:hypothetical protein
VREPGLGGVGTGRVDWGVGRAGVAAAVEAAAGIHEELGLGCEELCCNFQRIEGPFCKIDM